MKEMVETKNKLCSIGVDGWIHPHYEAFVRGEKKEHLERWNNGEKAELKRENNYLNEHYKNILHSDAVIAVNIAKNAQENYIGGNVLIELGQAFVNNKSIFLTNDIPKDSPYSDEIIAMDPICLFGKLENIKKYL